MSINLNIKVSKLNIQNITISNQDSKSMTGSISYTMYGGSGGTTGLGFGSNKAEVNRIPSLDVGEQSSTNTGYSINNGVTQTKQTVLSLVTANNLNVNVQGNTNLKGSLLASGNYDENGNFVDNKNLNLSTNSLTFSNLSNSSFSSNQSLGLNLNYNLEDTKIVNQKEQNQQSGISSVGYTASNGLNLSSNKTLATLGQGNITIKDKENSDEIERLDTDTQNINKDLYSSSTGIKVDATLDTRLLTEEGRAKIKDDYNTATAITNAIEQIVSNDKVGLSDFFDETQKNVDVYNGVKSKIANDEELAKQLQDPDLNPKDKQNMLNELALTVMKELGYVSNDVKLIYTDETGVNNTQVKGYFDAKTNTSYINDKNNDSTEELITTLGHELTHDMDKQAKIYVSNDLDQNIYATNFGEDLAFYTQGALSIITGESLADTNTHNQGIVTSAPSVFNSSNAMLNTNNQEFASIDKSGGDDLSAQDGAEISKHVYKDDNIYRLPYFIKEIIDEETLNKYGLSKKDLINEITGFKSGLYINTNTSEVTYAYAGTDPQWNDLKTDILQAIGLPTKAYKQAIDNAIKFNNATEGLGVKASLTGHSLGGGQAAAASEKTGLEAKTYNAAGVHPFTVINGVGTDNIDNYYMKSDPLTNVQLFIFQLPFASGNQHQLEPINNKSIYQNFMDGHSIDTIRENSNLKDKE